MTDVPQPFIYDPEAKVWVPTDAAKPDEIRRYINYLRKKRGGKRADRLEAYLKSLTHLT